MKIKEIYYKYNIYLIPAVVGIVCAGILVFVVIPQTLDYFKERTKIEELFNKIGMLNSKTEELKSVDEEAMKKDFVVALTVLPTDRDVPQAMNVLQGLINRSNLVLKSTVYSAGTKNAGKNGFSFTISVVGSLSSIKNFMSELQNSARVFKVESAELNFQGTGSLVEATMPLTVFYEPAPKTLITTDGTVPKISDSDQELITNLSQSIHQTETQSTVSATSVPLGKSDPFQ